MSQLNGAARCELCDVNGRTLREVHGHVISIRSDIGSLSGNVTQIDRRVERLERQQDKAPRDASKLTDLIPLAWGLLAVGLAAMGKIPWASVINIGPHG